MPRPATLICVTSSHDAPASPPEADPVTAAFVAAMGGLATPVTVVGAAHDGRHGAQTVSAMASVSSEPPMLLVCLNKRSPVNELIRSSGRFSVNALGTQHDHVADTFAGRPWPGKDRWDFSCGDWDSSSGVPRLTDAPAHFDCEVHHTVEAGTHYVHFGRVKDVTAQQGTPLIYAGRSYAEPAAVAPSEFPDYPDAHPDNRFTPSAPVTEETSA